MYLEAISAYIGDFINYWCNELLVFVLLSNKSFVNRLYFSLLFKIFLEIQQSDVICCQSDTREAGILHKRISRTK